MTFFAVRNASQLKDVEKCSGLVEWSSVMNAVPQQTKRVATP